MLNVTISTCKRTHCSKYCLNTVLDNLVYDGNIKYWLCCDRSSDNHIETLTDVLVEHNADFSVVRTSNKHYGYGYVLNTALDQIFQKENFALTIEDDHVLLKKTDITPYLRFLESRPKYMGLRVNRPDGYINCNFLYDDAGVVIYDFLKRKHRYNLQCMIRTKTVFTKYRFPENVSHSKIELSFQYLNVPVLMGISRDDNGHLQQIFKHVGYNPKNPKIIQEWKWLYDLDKAENNNTR